MPREAKQFAHTGDISQPRLHERSESRQLRNENSRNIARSFVFCEIPTQLLRFRVPADADGNMPVEQVAEMLAVHCLALNRSLDDFQVSVLSQSALPAVVTQRAAELIAAGRSIGPEVRLTPQEQLVFDGIVQSLQNKEIAARLGITLRTVKFHVSSLFAKFDVTSRTALAKLGRAGQTLRAGQLAQSEVLSPARNAPRLLPKSRERRPEYVASLVAGSR